MVANKLLITTLICNLLTACSSMKIYDDTVNSKIKAISIPPEFLSDCEIPEPPSLEDYRKQNFINKEVLLTNYSMELIKSNSECNKRIEAIRKLNDDFKKDYEEPSKH